MRPARDSFLSLALLLALAAAGCDRDGERRGMPPSSDWKPPAAEASQVEGAGKMAEGDSADPHAGMDIDDGANPHAGLDMGDGAGDPHAGLGGDQDPHANLDMGEGDADMAGLAPPDPDRPIDASKFLRGTIRAGKEVAAAIKPGAVLFLSARPVDPNTGEVLGSPVAVAKLALEKLPMQFELSERDVMVDGTRFEGEVLIIARVDGDGEARTKEPGDVEGQMRARIPSRGLDLVLDTALR